MSWARRTHQAEVMKAYWGDPDRTKEHREQLTEALQSDEVRQKISASKRGKPLSERHVAAIKAGKAKRKSRQERGD